MKQKILLSLFLVSCLSYSSMAQLTTGKSSANVFRNGNRASEGDFGLYFGTTTNMINKARNSNVELSFMPLVNLKYMYTDNIECRLGIELNKWSTTESGSIKVGSKSYDANYKLTEVEHNIYPGFAYHFSNTNLLDVYAGAELPLGYKRSTNKTEEDETDYSSNVSRFAYHIGLGGFIGVQAYIANLPVAVGVEYGISSMFDFGLKTKNEVKIEDEKQTSYTSDLSGRNFEDLSVRTGEIGNQVRLTLTYFFNK